MDPLTIGVLGGLGLNAVTSYLNWDSQQDALDFNKDQWAWQKKYYKKQMKREDNAVQRRVKDLRKAGLSPTLAAGSAASAAGPPSSKVFDAPQIQTPDVLGAIQTSQQIAQSQAQVGLTDAQKALTEAQVTKTPEEIKNLQSQAMKNSADARRAQVAAAAEKHDLDIAKKHGTPVRGTSMWGSTFRDAGSMMDKSGFKLNQPTINGKPAVWDANKKKWVVDPRR